MTICRSGNCPTGLGWWASLLRHYFQRPVIVGVRLMVAQMMNDAASLTRKSTTEAISSGSPERPSALTVAASRHDR
jgi:hypothetical protein